MIVLKLIALVFSLLVFTALIEFKRPLSRLLFKLATPKLQAIKQASLKQTHSPFERSDPSLWVAESENAYVLKDIRPRAPHHYLVIPKNRVPTLLECDDGLLAEMLKLAKQIAHDAGIAEDGFRIVINTNPQGLQTVYHLHIHVLGGRQMGLPIG